VRKFPAEDFICAWFRDAGLSAAAAESIELADESMQEVRTLSYLLHPPLLEETGLLSALRLYVSGFEKRSGITVTLDAQPECERLSQDIQTAVFRIVQECLTNIYAHSGSPTATLRLIFNPGSLILEVQDSGRERRSAFLKIRHLPSSYLELGLWEYKERVHQLGGQVKIDSTGRGTRDHASTGLLLVNARSSSFWPRARATRRQRRS